MADRLNILVVEDEVAIAEDLRDVLEMAGYHVVDVAYTYAQAVAAIAAHSLDLVFLDIALGSEGTGLDIAKILQDKYQLPFIFLTSFSDADTIQQVVSCNPGAYIVKPFKERDIAPAVALAMAQHEQRTYNKFPSLDKINANQSNVISAQEYKVLLLMWKGKRNADIAQELFVSINTIKSHISSIYNKLDVKSRTEAVNRVLSL